jgi:hypothetical protein
MGMAGGVPSPPDLILPNTFAGGTDYCLRQLRAAFGLSFIYRLNVDGIPRRRRLGHRAKPRQKKFGIRKKAYAPK